MTHLLKIKTKEHFEQTDAPLRKRHTITAPRQNCFRRKILQFHEEHFEDRYFSAEVLEDFEIFVQTIQGCIKKNRAGATT